MSQTIRRNRLLVALIVAQLLFDLFVLINTWTQTLWQNQVTHILLNAGIL